PNLHPAASVFFAPRRLRLTIPARPRWRRTQEFSSSFDSSQFVTNGVGDPRRPFIDALLRTRLDHDASERLGAGEPYYNTPCARELLFGGLNFQLYLRKLLQGPLLFHAYVDEFLRKSSDLVGEIVKRFLGITQNFEHPQRSEDAVARRGVFSQDDVPRLLAAQRRAALQHLFEYILVAHRRAQQSNTLALEGFLESEIRHDSRDHGIAGQFARALHRAACQEQHCVAIDNFPAVRNEKRAIGIAIEGNPCVGAGFEHSFAQRIERQRTANGGGQVVAIEMIEAAVGDQRFGHRLFAGIEPREHQFLEVFFDTVG